MYLEPEIEIRKRIVSAHLRERVVMDDGETFSLSPYKEPAVKEEYRFEPISLDEILKSRSDYVIVGESGIGKSSFLMWTAKVVAEKGGFIPLVIELKDIADYRTRDELFSFLFTEYEMIKEYDLTLIFIQKNTPYFFHDVAHNLKTSFRSFSHGMVVS